MLAGDVGGPVVLDLVVVEGDQPRRDRVGGLEVGVALVLGVPHPVVGQRRALHPARVGADVAEGGGVAVGLVFVHVVAQVDDQVGLLLGQPAVGRVVAVLPVGARRDGEGERRQGGGAGPGAADGRDGVLGAEAVEVLPARLETRQFDVHAVRGRGPRRRPSRPARWSRTSRLWTPATSRRCPARASNPGRRRRRGR